MPLTPGTNDALFPIRRILAESFRQNSQERFRPKQVFGLCSAHFDDSCFHVKGIPLLDDCGKTKVRKRCLIRGSIPSKDTVVPYTSPLTSRFSPILLRVF